MEGWETTKLAKVCFVDKAPYRSSGLPYVGMEDIESGTGNFIGRLEPRNVQSTSFHFKPYHLLYGRLRPYLNKVLLPDFEGHCSTEIFPIKTKECLDRKFLFYWLINDGTVDKINKTSTGARMPRANFNQVLNFDFPLPTLPEQRRIEAILDEAFSAIDHALDNSERNKANARELFDSYLNAIFSNPGPDWERKTLGELAEIKHGYAFKSQYFSEAGEFVLLTPGNFYEEGGYRDRGEKQKYYTGEIPEDFILKKDDILLAMTEQAAGLLGSPLIVPEDNKFLHNQRLGLLQPYKETSWSSEFFFHVFNTKKFRDSVHLNASGVKVRHTSPTKLKSELIYYPRTINEQRQIAAKLQRILDDSRGIIETYQSKINALEELKQSLLHQAFTGQLTKAPDEALETMVG